ncbi:MAG: hypothetical protein ACXVCP_03135 [Bdellovibrio sp.]
MYNEIQNLKINDRLVKRHSDFCLFDAESFKLFKFNADGFEILQAIDGGKIEEIDFEDSTVIEFISNCRINNVLINKCQTTI